jgi:hypothetical protein
MLRRKNAEPRTPHFFFSTSCIYEGKIVDSEGSLVGRMLAGVGYRVRK